jgi:hypothetical protein
MSINETLKIAPESPFAKELFSGIANPMRIRRVSVTAICAITLFSDFTPLFTARRRTPKITGIKAVGDGVVD